MLCVLTLRETDVWCFQTDVYEFVTILAWDPGGKSWLGANSDVGQWGLINFKEDY